MASLTNTKIKNTYVSLLKVADNGQLDAALQDITDGAGNTTGIQLNTGGDLTASGTVAFGSLKDSGENITITKFVDAADGIGSNNNDTTIPTSAAVSAYVSSQITLEDLDFAGDSGTGSVDLDSQTLTIQGTANEIETVASNQTLTIGLPSTINVNVNGNLTGTVTSASVLQDGVTATTQLTSDSSTKVATTAFVKSVLTLENLDIAGSSGTGSVDLDSQALTIAGTTNEIETVASGQTITVGLPSDVTIGNNLTVTTNATVGGTFGVTGATGVDGDFDVNTNKFNVQAATGNTSVAGTLGVTGNTTLSTVDVTGLASLDGGIDVDGAFTVADTSGNISTSGTLGVTGTSTLGVINASGLASLDGGIDVDGAFTVADTTGNVSTTGSITAATGTINGLLDVVGEVQATFLDINGNGELSGNFAVDTDTLFVDSVNDRVGVNKTNPAVALDVTGDITSSGTITGTTLAGTLSTAAQPNITSVGTLSSLAVSGNLTVDTNTLFVDAANNEVGIGTNAPASKLHIDATIDGDGIRLQNSVRGHNYLLTTAGSNAEFFSLYDVDNAQYLYQAGNTAHIFSTGGTERMRIDSSGNVGIGTSSPNAKLSSQTAKNNDAISIINSSATVTAQEVNYLAFYGTSNASVVFSEPLVRIGARSKNGSVPISDLIFYTNNGSTPIEAARFNNSGNLAFPNGQGIDFSASAGGGASSSLLDDYEEGTFTATLKGGTTDPTTPVTATSNYTKIGNQVTIRVAFATVNTTGASGTVSVQGLPFTAFSTATAPVLTQSFDFAGGTSPVGWLNGTTTVSIFASVDDNSFVDVLHNAGAGRWLAFTMTYFV